MKLTYCSFADKKCLGVVLLPGDFDPIEASMLAHMHGINPGGELLAIPFDTEDPRCPQHSRANLTNPAHHLRLFTKEEAAELFEARRLGDMDPDTN